MGLQNVIGEEKAPPLYNNSERQVLRFLNLLDISS